MSFAIVVDSTADLSAEECQRYGIEVVPLSVEVGGGIYKDQVEISSDEFYDKMVASDTLPKSSQPSPSDFMEKYNALAKAGNSQVVSYHLAAVLSGTMGSSSLAASQVEVPVEVIDSYSASAGCAVTAIQASRMRDAGASAEEVIEYFNEARTRSHFFIACDTLDNLLAGGRLSAEEVDSATMLNIKPMMSFDEKGVLKAIDKAKGMNGVIKKYVEKLAQLTEESGIQHVRFCHSRNEKGVEKLKKALSEAGIEYIDEGTCLCGAIVATHLGVGALGFGALPDKF